MKLRIDQDPVEHAELLKRRTYSPLCGLVTSVGYSLPPPGGPRVRVNGGELTGMHALLGRPDPKPGSYHIGGVGLNPFESEIKVYAEAAERYCAGTAILHSKLQRVWGSRAEVMHQSGEPVLDLSDYGFSRQESEVFDPYVDGCPMTWVRAPRVGTEGFEWVPAELFYLGYNPRRHDGEPWVGTAVTTGTAVHTTRVAATIAAAYELIQVDAAMGFWHGTASPIRIHLGSERTARLERLVGRYAGTSHELRFYWLPSPGLPPFTVACLMVGSGNQVPLIAAGLGADCCLEDAMYKAFLECAGVRMLSVWTSFESLEQPSAGSMKMLDLDSNVSFYARDARGAAAVLARFESGAAQSAIELPNDLAARGNELAGQVLGELSNVSPAYAEDFTTNEISGLGLNCVRLWCPGLLALTLPSAPMREHPRYSAYGGFSHPAPHPYP